ncbi:MAG TPA: pitrilysin family protein [Chryseosolibacter sp.]|nr:pitrilysin family protein [Chryseosolibacter sp.]
MLDRKTPPPFTHDTGFKLLEPVRKTFPNGIDIFFVSGGKQEVLKIEAVLRAGRWFETKKACAQFTASLLNKGTSKRSSFEIAQLFDKYGAHLEINPGHDYISVAVYGLTKHLEPVFDLFCEILTEASYPEKELSQHQSVTIQNLKVNQEKTSYIASQLFRKKLFGSDHPYGVDVQESDILALTTDDLKQYHGRFFTNMSLFVSGMITPNAQTAISDRFQSWKTLAVEADPTYPLMTTQFNEHVQKEGAVQASLRMGMRSIQRDHADYASVIFVSHILGGYFGSRLMKNIREEKGLTYGIYASLHPLQRDAYLVIGTDVNKENIHLTIDEIQKELRLLASSPVADDELSTAKNHFIGSLQSEITTPFAHTDKIKTIFLGNLPQDYYQRIIREITSLSSDDIMRISSEYFSADDFSVVSVG